MAMRMTVDLQDNSMEDENGLAWWAEDPKTFDHHHDSWVVAHFGDIRARYIARSRKKFPSMKDSYIRIDGLDAIKAYLELIEGEE